MTPVKFIDANSKFVAPEGYEESQVATISAYVGQAMRGSCEGAKLIVVAWKLDEDELSFLQENKIMYLTMLGGLAPHYLSLTFEQAKNPA